MFPIIPPIIYVPRPMRNGPTREPSKREKIFVAIAMVISLILMIGLPWYLFHRLETQINSSYIEEKNPNTIEEP